MNRYLVSIFVLLALALTTPAGLASPGPLLNSGSELSAADCDSGSMVVNVTQSVVNDADSGLGGYWAFDNYTRRIQVREIDEDLYCATVQYTGQFETFGANSPGGTGHVDAGLTGTMIGGYRATIEGTFDPTEAWPTRGFVGEFDYGCDTAGSCSGRVDWVAQYFGSNYDFSLEWWGWIYRAGSNGTWVNSIDGNEGDIKS